MTERWKPIEGFEDWYVVSDHGRVRWRGRKNKRGGRLKGKTLKLTTQTGGYLKCLLYRDGVRCQVLVHRLVASAFLPLGRDDQTQINHKDGNKKNNVLSNLEWVSARENMQHACGAGLIARGDAHGNSKLTAEQAKNVYRLAWEGTLTQREIGEMMGVSQPTVSYVKQGLIWSHVTGASEK